MKISDFLEFLRMACETGLDEPNESISFEEWGHKNKGQGFYFGLYDGNLDNDDDDKLTDLFEISIKRVK